MPILAPSYVEGQLLFNNFKSGDANSGESVVLGGIKPDSVPGFGTFVNSAANVPTAKLMALPAGMSTSRHAGFAVRVNLDGSTKCFVRDQGVVSTGISAAFARMPTSTRSMLIGPGYSLGSSSWNGNLTVKLLAVWSTPLTDQQITENLSYLAALYSRLMQA